MFECALVGGALGLAITSPFGWAFVMFTAIAGYGACLAWNIYRRSTR